MSTQSHRMVYLETGSRPQPGQKAFSEEDRETLKKIWQEAQSKTGVTQMTVEILEQQTKVSIQGKTQPYETENTLFPAYVAYFDEPGAFLGFYMALKGCLGAAKMDRPIRSSAGEALSL
jgi:hypothetical protein